MGAFLGRSLGVSVLVVLSFQTLSRGLSPDAPGTLLRALDGANLIFHEAGHIFLLPFGEFFHYLGGSLMQVAIPATCAVYFWRHQQLASSATTIFWTGQSITNVAIYISDAHRMELPLIGGDHDWNYLLDRLNLLGSAEPLGRFVFVSGAVVILFALFLLVADLARAWKQREE